MRRVCSVARLGDVRHVFEAAALRLKRVEEIDAGFFLRQIGARLDQRQVELGQLLLAERCRAAALYKTVLGAKLRDGFLGFAKLRPQPDQPVAEPGRGPFRRLETGIELIDQICLGDRIGQPSRFGRVRAR